MKVTDDQILDAIDGYRRLHGYSPTMRELCELVGMRSSGSIHNRLKRMRRDGLVSFDSMRPRTLATTRDVMSRIKVRRELR